MPSFFSRNWGGCYELYKPDFAKLKKVVTSVPLNPRKRKIWTIVIDNYTPYIHKEYGRAVGKDTVTFIGYKETLWHWRDNFQNDFAARMDWCIKTYQEANHPSVPMLGHFEEIVKYKRIVTLSLIVNKSGR